MRTGRDHLILVGMFGILPVLLILALVLLSWAL